MFNLPLKDEDFYSIINGVPTPSPTTIPVIQPSNKSNILAHVPVVTAEQLDAAVDAAEAAFPAWSAKSWSERGEYLVKVAEIIEENAQELSDLLMLEQGKARVQTDGEITVGVMFWRGVAPMRIEDIVHKDDDERRIIERRVPLGVCAGITAWNGPMVFFGMKTAPAILSGNTFILKPSPYAPLSTLRLGQLIQKVLPPGVVNILSGDDSLGPMISAHPRIMKLSFTGSTPTGKAVMRSAAGNLKRLVLELGGNDAAIVMPDADIKKIAFPIFIAAYSNSGQICANAKRIYVHADIFNSFLAEFLAIVKATSLKDPVEYPDHTGLSTMQNAMQFARAKMYWDDCVKNGYEVVSAFEPDWSENNKGYYVPPAIVIDPPEDAKVVVDEQFVPLVPILKYTTEEEVIQRTNNSVLGLSATIWGTDLDRMERVAERLEAGGVWLNEWLNTRADVPQPPMKQSGIGAEGGITGLKEWTNVQVIYRNKKPPSVPGVWAD